MSFRIQSGGTNSHTAYVDNMGRLWVNALQIPEILEKSEGGKAFYIASGFIDITTANTETGIIYFTNSTDSVIKIDHIRTCGTATNKWKLYKNPTGGTLITDAVSAYINNINFMSGNPFTAKAYKGSNGKTVTGGIHLSQWINGTGHSINELYGSIIIGPNNSIALTVECPTITTNICTNMLIFFENE